MAQNLESIEQQLSEPVENTQTSAESSKKESGIHISLTAEPIYHLGSFKITNSLLTSWIAILFLSVFAFLATRQLKKIPGNLQQIAEIVVEGIYGIFSSILGKKVATFFPIIATIFLYIIILNWLGLLPGVGTIGLHKIENSHQVFVPLFRAGTADLNTTLALSIFAMILIQITGFKSLGIRYLQKFFNFTNPINFFVGILELISEFSKVISFAFRLFGNIFAGEVLLTVIAFLIPIIAPIPFMGLELFVGFIQALVFSMLTAVFLSLATVEEHH